MKRGQKATGLDSRKTAGLPKDIDFGMPGLCFFALRENMGKKIVNEQKRCPFTLDPFEECSIRIIVGKKPCPFTFEPCLLMIPQ